jgi:HSP20 family protein
MNILFEDGVLTVKGKRKEVSSDHARRYFAQEIGCGGLSRSFQVPSYIDLDKVSASLKDGVFILDLPKRDEAKPRRIEII